LRCRRNEHSFAARRPADTEAVRNSVLSVQNGDKAIDAVDVEATWQRLASRLGSQLIDVRTRAEWAYVGIPDLGPMGKRAVLVEWQTFPDQAVDPRFAERLAGELRALGLQLDDDLFFICRSGSRSLAAAKAMAAAGYRACHNVAAALALFDEVDCEQLI
jgi:rhodanese-related sulfurtransferase